MLVATTWAAAIIASGGLGTSLRAAGNATCLGSAEEPPGARGAGETLSQVEESCAIGLPCPLGKGWGPERALRSGLLATSMDLSPSQKLPLVAIPSLTLSGPSGAVWGQRRPPAGPGLGACPPLCHLGNGGECGLRRRLSWSRHLCEHLPEDLSTTHTGHAARRGGARHRREAGTARGGHPKPAQAGSGESSARLLPAPSARPGHEAPIRAKATFSFRQGIIDP